MGAFDVSYHTIISLFSGNTKSIKESHGNVCTLLKIAPFMNETNFPNKIAFLVYSIENSLQRDKHSTLAILIVYIAYPIYCTCLIVFSSEEKEGRNIRRPASALFYKLFTRPKSYYTKSS